MDIDTDRFHPKEPDALQMRSVCQTSHPAVASWLSIQRLVAETERVLGAALRACGLNQAQFAMLLTIGTAEGLTQQDLADRRGLTKANVSQILDRLESGNLILRVPERRSNIIELTDRSRRLLIDLVPEQETLINNQFASLAPDEQVTLQHLMHKLVPDIS